MRLKGFQNRVVYAQEYYQLNIPEGYSVPLGRYAFASER